MEIISLPSIPLPNFGVMATLNVLNLYAKNQLQFFDSGVYAYPTDPSSIEAYQATSAYNLYLTTPTSGKSPWMLISDDPLYLTATPEPAAAVALLGMAVAGLGIAAIRRRRRK